VRFAHKMCAVEQQAASYRIGLPRKLTIRADDRTLATGNPLHWLVVSGWWLVVPRTTNHQPLTGMLKSILP
jgi:hypothetical protein